MLASRTVLRYFPGGRILLGLHGVIIGLSFALTSCLEGWGYSFNAVVYKDVSVPLY